MTSTPRDNPLYQLVDCRHGLFLANPRDIYVGRSMIRYGEWSELEWVVLDQVTPTGGVVIEVGSNIGSHTVPMASKVGPRDRHAQLSGFEEITDPDQWWAKTDTGR